MRDRMERFVLLPFTVGCMSESSVAVGMQQAKRSKHDVNSTPTRTPGTEKGEDEEDEEYEDDGESLFGEQLKSQLSVLSLPRVQKLFKNFSQLFAYKDELEEDEEEMGMEIGLPTDVKHVTHIGLDGSASSILSKDWNNNINEPALSDFPSSPVELAMETHSDAPTTDLRSLLENKFRNYHDNGSCNTVSDRHADDMPKSKM